MNKLVVVKWFSDSFMIRIESKRMLKKREREREREREGL